MERLRVILAGLGVRGRHWAEVLHRSTRCEVVAYVDPNPTARQHMNQQFGERPGFNTPEDSLEAMPDVGGLILANPPIGRVAQIQAAAQRHIPMLVEKPLALSVAEAAEMVMIAEQHQTPLMVGLNFRYLEVTIATRELLAQATVGQPAFARFTYERYRDGNRPDLNKYPLQMDQPMLWEQSIHHFDLMRYIYGAEPIEVQCRTWNPPWSMYASDANVAALFTFTNGMTVNYQGTWQSGWSAPHFEWRTDCTGGVIIQKDQFGALHLAAQASPDLTPVNLPPHELWITETQGLLDAFVKAVLDHKPLECSGRDHLHSLAMVEACVISSRESRTVPIASIMPQSFSRV
jgi:predicted dehydrogenase